MKITGVPSRIKKETARPPSPPCVSFSSALFLSLLVSLQIRVGVNRSRSLDCHVTVIGHVTVTGFLELGDSQVTVT